MDRFLPPLRPANNPLAGQVAVLVKLVPEIPVDELTVLRYAVICPPPCPLPLARAYRHVSGAMGNSGDGACGVCMACKVPPALPYRPVIPC